jgi:anti-sigma regulatory factor (Ser/Thr protein kinase)
MLSIAAVWEPSIATVDTSEAVLDFRVAPQPHASRIVRDRVSKFALENGVGEDDLAHFLIALGEALANAIEHACADAPVEIELRIGHDRILATVQDSGIGFPADVAIAQAHFPESDSERGRGLPIMRSCCEIFALKTEPGKGTAVVLGRYLKTPKAVA